MHDNMNQTIGDSNALYGICSDNVQQEMKAAACDECKRWFHQACGKSSNHILKKINNAPQSRTCFLAVR